MSVTVQQIALELGRPAPASGSVDAQRWTQWVADARLQIRTRLGDLDQLDQELLDYVTRLAVAAMVRRPDDATDVEVSVDDGRTVRRYSSSPGRVVVADEWIGWLTPAGSSSAAFSIRPSYRPDTQPWC